jgi:hypothetical protein
MRLGVFIRRFSTNFFLQGEVSLTPNPQPGGPGPPETGLPSYTPRHCVTPVPRVRYFPYPLTWASEWLVTVRLTIISLTIASLKTTSFWDRAPCSLIEVDRRFRGAYCLHQGQEISHPSNGSTAQIGPWPPPFEVSKSHRIRRTVGLLWTSDQPVAEASTYTGQHNIETQETNIHLPSGIWTSDWSQQPSGANLRLRLRGHWDRRWNLSVPCLRSDRMVH